MGAIDGYPEIIARMRATGCAVTDLLSDEELKVLLSTFVNTASRMGFMICELKFAPFETGPVN